MSIARMARWGAAVSAKNELLGPDTCEDLLVAMEGGPDSLQCEDLGVYVPDFI